MPTTATTLDTLLSRISLKGSDVKALIYGAEYSVNEMKYKVRNSAKKVSGKRQKQATDSGAKG